MKGTIWIRKAAAVLLAVSMVAAAAGCGAKSQPDGGKRTENGTMENGGKESGARENTGDAGAVFVPKGRYMEQAVSLPFEDGEEIVLDLIKTPDGTLVMFTRQGEWPDGKMKEYRYDGSVWKEAESSQLDQLSQDMIILYSAFDGEGTLYLLCADKDYKTHLFKVEEGKPAIEPVVIEDSAVLINGIQITGDGRLFIPSGDHVFVIGTDGTTEKRLPQRSSYSNFCDSHALTKNSYITAGDRGFLRYDLSSLNETEVIPYQSGEDDLYGSLTAGEGDDFYLANAKGIHHMADQGTMWETVVDGSLNSMSMPSVSIKRLFTGGNNDFYLWYMENQESRLVHYTYDPEMASVPSKTLTVYGLNLSENQTLKQAASLFQMEHPDVRVELIDGSSDSGSTLKSDTIRSLNTELLNGSGADVLVLDGLPAQSYIEKGILEDLKGVITPLVESGELYSNVAENFTGSDGSIYQFPVRLEIPVIYGDEAVINQMTSLEAVLKWQQANPDKALFSKTIYENILRQLIFLYYPQLEGDGKIMGKDQVIKLLETAKAVGDACGSKMVFDESEDGGNGRIYNRFSLKGNIGNGGFGLMARESEIAIENITGMESVMMPYAIAEKLGYRLNRFQDIYYPQGLLGVTAFSKEKETAMEFAAFTLSRKVQDSDLRDGFPVSRAAKEAWSARTSEISISVGSSDDDMIGAMYPDEEKKEAILAMIDGLHTPIVADEVLLEMMISETKGYFEGKQTAAEAAAQFENKSKLYYAE